MRASVFSQPHRLTARGMRPTAWVLLGSMSAPLLVGCDGPAATTSQPTSMTRQQGGSRPAMNRSQGGMSTKQKVALLAGAAALYYIYNKRKAAKNEGPQGKLYRSESTGRLYYRDLKTGTDTWVSPPTRPIRVPMEEAQSYQGYQGFNNAQDGRGFGGYGTGRDNYDDAVPAQF